MKNRGLFFMDHPAHQCPIATWEGQ